MESRKGVKAVPYDAIEEDSDGTFYVYKAMKGPEESEAYVPEAGVAGIDNIDKKNDKPSESTQDFDKEGSPGDDSKLPEGKAPGNKAEKNSYSSNPLANLIAEKMIGKSAVELYMTAAETPTKKVTVEKGLESDYYTEIISDELKTGDEVLIPDSSDSGSGSFGFGMMGGPGGPPGGF